jgi:hypothetical protein
VQLIIGIPLTGLKKLIKTIDFYAFCFAKEKSSSIFARTFAKGNGQADSRKKYSQRIKV